MVNPANISISKEYPAYEQLIDHMEGFEWSKKCDLCISYRGNLAMHIDKL